MCAKVAQYNQMPKRRAANALATRALQVLLETSARNVFVASTKLLLVMATGDAMCTNCVAGQYSVALGAISDVC